MYWPPLNRCPRFIKGELDLFSETDYVITYNGSLVQKTKTKEIVSEFGLTHEEYLEVEMTARKLGVHLHVETQDTMYTANRDISPYTVYEAFWSICL